MAEIIKKIFAFFISILYTLFPSLSPAQHADEYKLNGDKMYVCLETNASTGYTWVVKECDESVIKLKSREIQKDAKFVSDEAAGIVGASSKELFTFEGVGAGSFKIVMSYERTFEKNSSVKTRTFIGSVDSKGNITVDDYIIKN
ncbi:MAG: protease inhibitor I42 family protein [Clostridia bacterium]|nr:protease inhibitor I42 family protein [Clostridia bacterium]